jgi:hypothetical protein
MVHAVCNSVVLDWLASLNTAWVYHNGPHAKLSHIGLKIFSHSITPALTVRYKFIKKFPDAGTYVVIDIKCELASVRRSDKVRVVRQNVRCCKSKCFGSRP